MDYCRITRLHYPFVYFYFCFGIIITLFLLINGVIISQSLNNLYNTMNRNMNRANSIISILIVFSVIHCVLISSYWIGIRNKEIAIRKAFGFSNIKIILLIMRDLFQILICSVIIFSFIEYLFLYYFNKFLYDTYHIIIQNPHQIIWEYSPLILKTFVASIGLTILLPIRKIVKNLPMKYLK